MRVTQLSRTHHILNMGGDWCRTCRTRGENTDQRCGSARYTNAFHKSVRTSPVDICRDAYMGTFTLNMLSLAREGSAGMLYALNSLWLAATMQGEQPGLQVAYPIQALRSPFWPIQIASNE